MKIKCFRLPCEVCGNNQVASSIQVFFRKNGEVSYARARHLDGNKKFYYHQQSVEYVKSKLGEIGKLDQGQSSQAVVIDHEDRELSFKSGSVAGGEGFAPQSLGR